jgi:hypothetical protein
MARTTPANPPMRRQVRFICERVRKNNGVVEVFFSRRDTMPEEHVLINVAGDPSEYLVGGGYLITIEPALRQA